ncbi:hypothetical protein MTsPCn3_00920 [Erythrobacter sp. MTPC3]
MVLSDLFLDTEPTPQLYQHIARTARAGSFSNAEVEAIFREDVAPAFYRNLLDVAGEWVGWPEDVVREWILRYRERAMHRAASRLLMGKFITEQWVQIEAALAN